MRHEQENIESRLRNLEEAQGQQGTDTLSLQERLLHLEELYTPETVFRNERIELITGTSNPELARAVGEILQKKVDDRAVTIFADRTPNVRVNPNMRGRDVYVIQPSSPPDINRAQVEQLLLIDAAYRGSANKITLVEPFDGFSRSDRKDRSRIPIAAALMLKLKKAAGATSVIGIDPHFPQIQGFYDGPYDTLYGSYALLPTLQTSIDKPLVIAAPDTGAAKHAEKLARLYPYSEGTAIVYKTRTAANLSDAVGLMGDVAGRTVVLADDMIDTAGSMVNAARLAIDNGASEVYAMATHGLFSEVPETNILPLERISNSPIKGVFITDTIAHREAVLNHPLIHVVSIAPLLAEAIRRTQTGQSLSELILS